MSAEPNIRNRVAGAVVLVSLAVIFLPLILDGKKKNQIIESTIPDKPKSGEIILINIDDNKKTADIADSATQEDPDASDSTSLTIPAEEINADKSVTQTETSPAEQTPKPTSKPKDSIKKPVPTPERSNRPVYANKGHLVQLGSFSSRDNASRLVSSLQKASHRAYYKSGESNGKTIFRVFSGPYLERSEAEQAVTAIKKLANVNPIIVTYDPLKHSQG